MVGRSFSRLAKLAGYEVIGSSSKDLDFTDREGAFESLIRTKPDILIIAAAKVGGILANSQFPVEFLSKNLQIQTNVIDAAHAANIEKVIFLGSSCIYPKFAQQPIKESELLQGSLEETNKAYAIAKIAGIELINSYRRQFNRNWISIMPTNLYGPYDNFDLKTSHALPALLKKVHIAKSNKESYVKIWGDGSSLREFLYVDDLSLAILHLLKVENKYEVLNIGSGQEISILNLTKLISRLLGFEGQIEYDNQVPNGTPRKLLDSSRMNELGWDARHSLEDGIIRTYKWYLETQENNH